MVCSHSSASTQVAWAFAKRLGTGAAGVPNTNEPDDVACAEASRKMFEAWSEECILRFPDGDFKAQELANAVWAVATAGFEASDEFWDSAARAAVPLMRDPEQAQTQNIANCLWSYAKSGDGTPAVRKELFSELADAASKRVDEFNAQELGNTVRYLVGRNAYMSTAQAWAYATASIAAPELFDAIAASAEGRVERFIAQNLANTAWAFATASHRAPRLLDAVAREAARRADEFKPQELANTVPVAASLIVCHLTPPPRRRPGPSPPVAETTPSTPDYKSSSSTTSRGRPTNDSIGSRTKACRTSRGRSRPPARPRGTRNYFKRSQMKRRRAWPSSSPRASRT